MGKEQMKWILALVIGLPSHVYPHAARCVWTGIDYACSKMDWSVEQLGVQ